MTRRFYPPTHSDLSGHEPEPYRAMHYERMRAHEKHKDKPGGSMEVKDFDSPDWLPVLVEEVGEVAKELCDHRHGIHDRDTLSRRLREELVQVGAMVAAWIDAIDLDEDVTL